jgi:hypothetical protein
MTEKRLKYRMYFFVNDKLSNKEKVMQAGKAALEYAVKYKDEKYFQDFVFWDKTWVIFDGETSNDGHMGCATGSMEELYESLRNASINCTTYYEHKINSTLTAICFLADERVWDYDNYPDFKNYVIVYSEASIENEIKIRMMKEEDLKDKFSNLYESWLKLIGDSRNLFLRELIKSKKLLDA